ncbi:hypothetical protein [uncultured Microbacterium sp.]|uniref:hypothetical protein n=1 Tax=uncultured Microbacterium sp. TaxID=191216 RepID=UPI0028D09CC4|nr:hypothetical protein [uncultured Microbacterium sp.]
MTSVDRKIAALTSGGEAALMEYLNAERSRILAEATSLSDGGPLTAADIVNAYGALEARQSAPVFLSGSTAARSQISGSVDADDRRKWNWVLASVAAIVTGGALAAALAMSLQNGGEGWTGFWSIVIPIVAVGFAGWAVVRTLVSSARELAEARLLIAERKAARLNREAIRFDPDSSVRLTLADEPLTPDTTQGLEFVIRWGSVESDLRRLGTNTLGISEESVERYPIGELLRGLLRSGVITSDFYDDARTLLRVRNEILHSQGPSKSELGTALDLVEPVQDWARKLVKDYPLPIDGRNRSQ